MRIGYLEEHEQFRHTARTFLDREHEPNLKRYEAEGGLDKAFWRKAGEAGILGSCIPCEYGGAGGDFTFQAILAEELGRTVGSATTGSSLMVDIATNLLVQFGSEEQKQRYLPAILNGEITQAMPLTEPDVGSDATAISTRALRDGDQYVINGEKYFISNGATADLLYVVCKTDPSKRGRGMSIILVDPDTPGVQRHKIKMMGWGSGDTGALSFKDVRVPVSNLLGKEGQGMEILMGTFQGDRMQIAARCVGAAKAALELTLAYVQQREVSGQRVIDFQNSQFVLAEIRTDIAVGEAFLDTCLLKLRENRLSFDEGAMLKLWTTEMEGRVMDKCLQLFGGAGLMDDTPISRMYTAARIQRVYAGTSELQKVAIAKSLM
ncbi:MULTISPECIES: acyl-CoA dehydrogenase family protein [Pseudomonas]|uniref:acyl-CoA dehydrogenase family protein n=1 Tax=Pseudomonas TaxID=286 RepID=UPI00071EB13F|nr:MULTISPECIES: acyl-CoA dehydrogenase family protein [Pseudomonas]ALQ02604.1 Butyryl-CoA dehydrogenase [Pseudomonas brassicacearum]